MLSTKNVITDIRDIPSEWIFSYYCQVDILKFDGNNFNIKSVFNEKDDNPSMWFWYSDKGIRFNDFSSGNKGTAIDLVMLKHKLSFKDACIKIRNDFSTWSLDNVLSENKVITPKLKYQLDDYEIRKWNVLDKNYWLSYNISSKILDEFCVKPIEKYRLVKEGQELIIKDELLYGYFKKDGTLYKIYQPNIKDLKFVKIKTYIQGSEQVKNNKFLIYTSSLKDIMSIYSLNLKVDLKAPDSENTLIPKEIIEEDLKKYNKILTLFDVDEAGIKASLKYKEEHNIENAFLNYGEKDPSDHIKKYGVKKIAPILINLIHKHINDG